MTTISQNKSAAVKERRPFFAASTIRKLDSKFWPVAFIDRGTRVGRSQGASIFWGVVSVCFAAAACFYYFKNHENESAANQLRDTVLQLKEETETLNSQKEHLEASRAESESQLKTREELVQEKETELAAEETRLEGLGHQAQNQTQENTSQVTVVKKFNDLIRKLGTKDNPTDVVERNGRPVLRVPNATLFAPGDATLKPEGKALLSQVAQALNNQLDAFELRVVSYTDTNMEADAGTTPKKDATDKPAAAVDPDPKSHFATSWDLTAARAAAIARYYRDQSQLPFLNVIVVGRGDAEPISSNTGDNHARNRRVEITINPLPVPFHAPDADKTAVADPSDTAKPAPDTSAPAKDKPKAKNSDKTDKDKGH
jgi:flagellar motor protein MotB